MILFRKSSKLKFVLINAFELWDGSKTTLPKNDGLKHDYNFFHPTMIPLRDPVMRFPQIEGFLPWPHIFGNGKRW